MHALAARSSSISRIGRQAAAHLRSSRASGQDYVTDSSALLTFLQAAIQSVNVSHEPGRASTNTNLNNVAMKIDRTNIQFVTMPERALLG